MKSTAEARANIALVKYWGRKDDAINLPLTSSISLTLDGLVTRTTVEADASLKGDVVEINGKTVTGTPAARVAKHMNRLRTRADVGTFCRIASENSFASSAGLASSASAFAALTVAGFKALGADDVSEREATTFARLGSGSAARSIHGGFVEWHRGDSHESSYAEPIAPRGHMDLHDVAVTLHGEEKKVGSAEGHTLAATSALNAARVARVPALLAEVRAGIAARDIGRIGRAAEEDALLMHGVMMTGSPSLVYWRGETVEGIRLVREWREGGLEVYFTIDAGPNLHLLCMGRDAPEVVRRVRETWPHAQVRDCAPGEAARLVDAHLF